VGTALHCHTVGTLFHCHTVGTLFHCHTVGTYTAVHCHTVGNSANYLFKHFCMLTAARRAELSRIFRRVVRSLINHIRIRWHWSKLGASLKPQAGLFQHLVRSGPRLTYSPATRRAAAEAAAAAAQPEAEPH
jgi:hypothetical protein